MLFFMRSIHTIFQPIIFIIGKKRQSQIALPLFRRFDLILISKLSPKRSNTNQTKSKKQHAGRFGNAIS